MIPVYNMLMFALDLAAIWFLWQNVSPARWATAMGCVAISAVVLAVGLGGPLPGGVFTIAGVMAWGIFCHGTILCLASALVLWRAHRWASVGVLTLGAMLVATAYDAFLVEPNSLDVPRIRIESEKIDKPLKIVLLADLQAETFSDHLREALRRTIEEKADLILLAGDYVQTSCDQADSVRSHIRKYLHDAGFSAPLGIFAVRGNIDDDRWAALLAGLNVRAIHRTETVDLGPLRLTCLGLDESYDRNLALAAGPPSEYHIVLGHCPNFALGKVEADLLLAGHTHGGQVRLPFLGAVVIPAQIPKAWAAGLTNLPQGGKLLISRGIGVERGGAPQMRFLCRPEVVVIELVPAT